MCNRARSQFQYSLLIRRRRTHEYCEIPSLTRGLFASWWTSLPYLSAILQPCLQRGRQKWSERGLGYREQTWAYASYSTIHDICGLRLLSRHPFQVSRILGTDTVVLGRAHIRHRRVAEIRCQRPWTRGHSCCALKAAHHGWQPVVFEVVEAISDEEVHSSLLAMLCRHPATWNALGMRDDARNVMQPLSTVSLTPAPAYLASTSQNAPTSHLHRCGGCRVSLAEYILPVPVEASSSQILSQLPIDENHVQSNHEAWVFVQYTSRIPASSMSHADELALPSTQLL